ncbi:MAG: 16S rRNA (cytosine(967)-C(5))-methyltransferase RsmB [Methylococcales bacterium]|jgi:16S rRNA (cytosine967-C5)-methyltransferase|nr:16S rRNA (cytosine(967)-C(5))-methyltransferase RsmB [Methylococcales bacterium]MBT7410965.1 16S rRNA (cytosine(967)-C(5))-methyltransferase RsmB [Methylococcales bacterium]
MNSREVAVNILLDVLISKHSLSSSIKFFSVKLSSQEEYPFLQELCYGVIRRYEHLEAFVSYLVKKKIKNKDADIKILLMLGLYQIKYLRVPEHAAVSETVKIAKKRGQPKFSGFINGVLRNFIRNMDKITQQVEKKSYVKMDHPQWLEQLIRQCWGEKADEVLQANNRIPPITLRVNGHKIFADDFVQKLTDQGVQAEPISGLKSAFRLNKPRAIDALPGYDKGWFFVQDAGAQLAATLLDIRDSQRVLDACAAPGGKAIHLLEINSSINLTAVDIEPDRIAILRQNMARMDCQMNVLCQDILTLSSDQLGYDRILMDAPCSAMGVIRRHPDVKYLRMPEDIVNLVKLQQQILEKLWSLLLVGGKLLYVTCSILQDENENQIDQFLKNHADVEEIKITTEWGVERNHGIQLLPGEQNTDGFYYALLQKT